MANSRVFSAKVVPGFLITALAAVTLQCSKDAPLQLTPLIGLSASNVSFSLTLGSPDPAAQTVAITNAGDGTVDQLVANVSYAEGQPSGWLSVSMTGATAPAALTLGVSGAGLSARTYTANLAVSSAAADNGPQAITV